MHRFLVFGFLPMPINAMAQVGINPNANPSSALSPWQRELLSRNAQTPAPALMPPVQGAWPEPIEFSYSAPAFEAGQWWKGISKEKKSVGTEGLSASQLTQSGQAVDRFAQGHKDDAPLLMAWQVNGENWRVHLTPSEAVSNRYPPLIQEWGVPKKIESGNLPLKLVPVGDSNAVTLGTANPLIIWPSGNALRWQQLYLLSRSSQRWFPVERNMDVQFNLRPADINADYGENVLYRSWTLNGFQEAYLFGNAVYVPSQALNPFPALNAVIHQKTPRSISDDAIDKQHSDYVYETYKTIFWSNHSFLRDSVGTTPARLSRILATLDERYLTDASSAKTNNVPLWMQEGLQNLYSLETADKIADGRRSSEWFPPMAPEVQQLWDISVHESAEYLQEVEDYARRGGITDTPIDEATVWAGWGYAKPSPMMINRDTPNLNDLDSTSQMRFFFERFGSGAVTETLQRLGSGETFESALHETTGMTPAQFLAAWQETQKENEN